MGINEAVKILECMAIDFVGALGGLSETNPMVDVIRQRIDAIDTVKDEIKRLKKEEDSIQIMLPEDFDTNKLIEMLHNASVQTFSNEPALESVLSQEWFSVNKKLPKEHNYPYGDDDMKDAVLIYTPVDGYMHVGWYAGKDYRGRDKWHTLSAMRSYQICTKKVSHWTYLPKPPKGE